MTILAKHIFLLIIASSVVSCIGQNNKHQGKHISTEITENDSIAKIALPKNGFYCGLKDKEGNLWFGSRGNGIFKYNGKEFTNYTTENGLCDNDISYISEDKEGNLWFGTPKGACKYNGDTFSHLDIPKPSSSSNWLDKMYPMVNPNQVMSILEDSKGNFWFGTNGQGVFKYDGKSYTQHLSDIGKVYEDNLQHNIVLSIVEDLKGNIWFTSLSHGGVSVFDGEKFTHYTKELSDDFIRVAFCDKKGNIWIGTHGNRNGGLDQYDGNKFNAFHKTKDGFENNNVRWIYEDKQGKLWLGSGITELSTFDGNYFKKFKDENGKTFERIIFIIGDSKENIWFGSKNGLWKFDGKQVIDMTAS
ncbi:MAG: two-component regulator propeller domain-containing protein [Gelidibacter sp.]